MSQDLVSDRSKEIQSIGSQEEMRLKKFFLLPHSDLQTPGRMGHIRNSLKASVDPIQDGREEGVTPWDVPPLSVPG